jgi:hypothetical protein
LDPRDRDFISELLHSKIATGGGGESSKIETTSLPTVEETLDAPGRAQTVANRPPGNSRAACRLPATASYLASALKKTDRLLWVELRPSTIKPLTFRLDGC